LELNNKQRKKIMQQQHGAGSIWRILKDLIPHTGGGGWFPPPKPPVTAKPPKHVTPKRTNVGRNSA
jgi:hypothetical protein